MWIKIKLEQLVSRLEYSSGVEKISNTQLKLTSYFLIIMGIICLFLRGSIFYIPVQILTPILWFVSALMLMIARRRIDRVKTFLSIAQQHMMIANKSRTLNVFIENYNQLLETLQTLGQYERQVKFKSSPLDDYARLKNEYQKHIQDALRRETHYNLEDKNNLERKYHYFCKEIERYKNQFSKDTLNVSEECKNEHIAEIPSLDKGLLSIDQLVEQQLKYVDLMCNDGWKFEEYCKQILLDNGFVNAELTPKSNDYGVDIIITNSDGVKYAIQCKCYSSKLGNTPIQEVAAGREYYKCQVGVVMSNNYFTNNAVNLAKNNGILLWDRNKLKDMIKISLQKQSTTPITEP